jgi:hypothetical protein
LKASQILRTRAPIRIADLSSCRSISDDGIVVFERRWVMIDGLKLTLQGEVLKARVAKRIRQHEVALERYRADLTMDPEWPICMARR